MKILFCIGSLEKGGAERVISNLANSFADNDDISIVTTINKVEYELDKKVNLYSLDCDDTKKIKLNKIIRIKKLYNVIKIVNPDVIVSFLPEPTFRMLLIKKFIKTPIIVSVRNDPKVEYKGLRRKIFMKLLYPLADGFVFQTEEAKEFFNKKIQSKCAVIPNPIKKEFVKRTTYNGKKEDIIVTVGRLEEQKNQELLIDAFYDINREIKDYKLLIYGEGSLRSKLEEKIKNFNMQDRIFLLGTVDDIPEKIEKAKLFVMSSNYEGMPNALMEAMALGLCCISTDCPCGGPRFLIENNKNGFLIRVNNKEDLKNEIIHVLFDLNNQDLEDICINARKTTIKLCEENINSIWYNYIVDVQKRGEKNCIR